MANVPGTVPHWVKSQFFDKNGSIAASHLLYVFKAGTMAKAVTYSDSALTTENANPIVLDTAGRASIFVDRTIELKYVLVDPADTPDPATSNVWTMDNILGAPFYSIETDVTRVAPQLQWAMASPSDSAQTLDAPHRPVTLLDMYVNNSTGSTAIDIPAGTLDATLVAKGDGLVLEWEVDYASATLSARSEAFGTAVDIGTGSASTMTRARYVFYRASNTDVHVSTLVYQNTGAGATQIQMGQSTIGSLDLDNTDYTVDMKMSAGTWTIRGARAYFGKAFGDWQD